MAKNSTNNLVYYIEIDKSHNDYLANIRHWSNLKYGIESNTIWLKNFTEEQINSSTLLSIPYIKLYYGRDNLLFPKDSILPISKIPNLLWASIDIALKIRLDNFNHNYFGLNQSIEIKLMPSHDEKKAVFLLAEIEDVNQYILNTSSIRLNPLKWLIFESDKVLIWGEPMLPIKGKTYWLSRQFILPLGYDFEFPILQELVFDKMDMIPYQKVWWFSESEYLIIDDNDWEALSIASWRLTLKSNVYVT